MKAGCGPDSCLQRAGPCGRYTGTGAAYWANDLAWGQQQGSRTHAGVMRWCSGCELCGCCKNRAAVGIDAVQQGCNVQLLELEV